MGGWGRKLVLITPAGDVLPCHAAAMLPGMAFENVQAQPLREIWEGSDAFQKFRGEGWMPEPCRSCDRRERDFGGCRCQAFQLANDAGATDPVCSLSPQRGIVDEILKKVNGAPPPESSSKADWIYSSNPA
jgi:pyrroloquinoline quinone biosynthesis protein E